VNSARERIALDRATRDLEIKDLECATTQDARHAESLEKETLLKRIRLCVLHKKMAPRKKVVVVATSSKGPRPDQ
jgi:hypothetical protein